MKSTLKRLDAVHEKLTTAVSAVDPALLSKRPAEKEWSVAEVVEHLCLVEGAVMNYLKSRLDQPPVRVSPLKKLLPMRIVSLRVKRLEAPKIVRPSADLPPMTELLNKFNALRADTKEVCNTAGRERLSQICFKHPFFGDMDGAAAVSMVAFHEQRHLKQIREILKKLNN
jgi:DinB family protein